MAPRRGVACVQSLAALAALVAGVAVVSNALGAGDARAELHPVATITIPYVEGTPMLAADGERIAAASANSGPVAWNPATGETRDVGLCDADTIAVARAGNEVASICLEDTKLTRGHFVDVAWLDHKRPGFDEPVWTVLAGDCKRTCPVNVAGGGDLLVFNTFSPPDARWRLWRIVGYRSTLLRTDSQSLAVVAVDSGRIFVRRGGQLLVFDATGRQQAAYPSPGQGRVVVNGRSLVVRTRTGVSVLDLNRGSITHRWGLSTHAALQGTDATSFVYTTNLTLHIHHLGDPSDSAFTLAGVKGPINAQLTASGLFYSWQDITCCNGYVAFVPTAALPAAAR